EPGDVGVRLSGAGPPRGTVRELHPRPRRQLAVAADRREARRRGVRQLPRVSAELPPLSLTSRLGGRGPDASLRGTGGDQLVVRDGVVRQRPGRPCISARLPPWRTSI